MRIVVTDPIISRFAPLLQQKTPGHDWEFVAGKASAAQTSAITRADVLVCARLNPEDAATCTAGLVHITGSGTDRVALADLQDGTVVLRTAHHERSIAEHILMVTLAHQRRLLAVSTEMKAGSWRSVATVPGTAMHRMLDELTIGFVGLGGIGTEAVRMCTSLGMNAVAVRRNPEPGSASEAGLGWVKSMRELPELLAASDVVVLCLPLTPGTRGLMGATQFTQMRHEALLVNVSRGPIVDEDALHAALQGQIISGAALDVWSDPPLGTKAPDSAVRLAAHPQVIATPHYSGHAHQTFERRAMEIADNINAHLASKEPSRNPVD